MKTERAMFGMGCFWGAEKKFWSIPGVVSTSVGYAGGTTQGPTYPQVCSGKTGHAEVVAVEYDPAKVSFDALLKVFFESHNPTQLNRQGNDVGTQYRSGIYTSTPEQRRSAEAAKQAYQHELSQAGHGTIVTELLDAPPYFPAEEYHQKYLLKNPDGYCGLGGTGVSCPIGLLR